MSPFALYFDLMSMIGGRLSHVDRLACGLPGDFACAESAAFHGRKIIEGIAFSCLVATEHGLKNLPRDAKGKWNAESIFKSLKAKGLDVFPSPCEVSEPTTEEQRRHQIYKVIEVGVADRRVAVERLIGIYQQFHRWLHELNPYVARSKSAFYEQHADQLWTDLKSIKHLISDHFISISRQGFYCAPRGGSNGRALVIPLSKLDDVGELGEFGLERIRGNGELWRVTPE